MPGCKSIDDLVAAHALTLDGSAFWCTMYLVAGGVVVVANSRSDKLFALHLDTVDRLRVRLDVAFGNEVVALLELRVRELGRLTEHHQVGERRIQLREAAILLAPRVRLPNAGIKAGLLISGERQLRVGRDKS